MVITSWPLGTRRRVSTEGTVTVSAATKFSEVRRAPQAVQLATRSLDATLGSFAALRMTDGSELRVGAAFPSDSRGTALPCPAIELGEVEPLAWMAESPWFVYRWPPAGVFEFWWCVEGKGAGETPAVRKPLAAFSLCDEWGTACQASRSGTAPRTHAGSATCRAPTEER